MFVIRHRTTGQYLMPELPQGRETNWTPDLAQAAVWPGRAAAEECCCAESEAVLRLGFREGRIVLE